jgi:hypothetical protein
MKLHTRLGPTEFVKSFSIFFIGLTVLWTVAGWALLGGVVLGPVQLVLAVAAAAPLGYAHWRRTYRTVLRYDEGGFELTRGRRQVAMSWAETERVSLVHAGLGRLLVRLYTHHGERVDLPATDLGLEPWGLRDEVARYVAATKEGRQVGRPGHGGPSGG